MKLAEQKSAENDLWRVAQQEDYYNRISHSCVREFTATYPKQTAKAFSDEYVIEEIPPFIKDEFVWDGKIYGGSK